MNTSQIKAGSFIPDSERWIHQPKIASKIDKALQWNDAHPAEDTFESFIRENTEQSRFGKAIF